MKREFTDLFSPWSRRLLGAVLTLLLLLSTAEAKPKILFLFADDLSYEAIREFGLTDIDTPNLDRLAREGTTFSHTYNMGGWNGAICIASRTMLATGRSLWRAKSISDRADQEREAGRLWPQMMARAGYETYFTGKWHVKAKVSEAFDHVGTIRGGMPKDTKEGYHRPHVGQVDPWSPSDPKFGGFWEGGKHWSEVVADETLGFLEQAASSPKPFFMYVAFNAAHDPRQSPREYVERYPLERIAVPQNFLPLYPYHVAMGCGPDLRDEKLAPFPRDEYSIKVHRQEYYALITHLDTQIGRILEALEKSGQADDTWIFFTADHGLSVGHHGLLGKQNMYEDSLRVPFLVKGPGVAAGKTITTPIYLQDVMATALELAAAPPEEQVEFHSILPLLRDDASPAARDAIYGAYQEQQRAVIKDGWKLILYPKAKVVRLYHLTDDPQEEHDRVGDLEQKSRIRSLFATLCELQNHFADELELQAIYPELR